MMKQFSYRHTKEAKLMSGMTKTLEEAANFSDEELFSFAEFNAEAVERTGYSNYSYWRSTFQGCFCCLPSFSLICRGSMIRT